MAAPRRVPRSRPETLVRRREILDAASETFGARGFANGTLQEIAEQVGMTHAGILHHFGSKQKLLLAVLQHRDEVDVAHLEGQHIPDGIQLFRHLVQTAFRNAQRVGIVQAFTVLSGESVTDDHPARSFFEHRYRALRDDVARAFHAVCEERGIDSPERIAEATTAIIAVMDGLQVQWLLDPTALELGPATEFAIEAIVGAVLHPTSQWSVPEVRANAT